MLLQVSKVHTLHEYLTGAQGWNLTTLVVLQRLETLLSLDSPSLGSLGHLLGGIGSRGHDNQVICWKIEK